MSVELSESDKQVFMCGGITVLLLIIGIILGIWNENANQKESSTAILEKYVPALIHWCAYHAQSKQYIMQEIDDATTFAHTEWQRFIDNWESQNPDAAEFFVPPQQLLFTNHGSDIAEYCAESGPVRSVQAAVNQLQNASEDNPDWDQIHETARQANTLYQEMHLFVEEPSTTLQMAQEVFIQFAQQVSILNQYQDEVALDIFPPSAAIEALANATEALRAAAFCITQQDWVLALKKMDEAEVHLDDADDALHVSYEEIATMVAPLQ